MKVPWVKRENLKEERNPTQLEGIHDGGEILGRDLKMRVDCIGGNGGDTPGVGQTLCVRSRGGI